ncbi:hypothetical protein IIC_06117 [Bacillus cereus VD021]|uniref:HTH cro/C1-type domain-containing protein n=2 Tax=Bacillus TaxID=1386 RepID=R8GY13_BACCE|nr:hypothetical protein IIC_06117 [Bacillus cereus VD021]
MGMKGDMDVGKQNTDKNVISLNSDNLTSSKKTTGIGTEDGFDPRRLRYLRKKHGLKVEQIIEYIEVARSTYTGYEQGHRTPPPKTIVKLAEILHTTPNYLCGCSDIEENMNDDLKAMLTKMDLNWDGHKLTETQKIQIANIINGYFQSVPK